MKPDLPRLKEVQASPHLPLSLPHPASLNQQIMGYSFNLPTRFCHNLNQPITWLLSIFTYVTSSLLLSAVVSVLLHPPHLHFIMSSAGWTHQTSSPHADLQHPSTTTTVQTPTMWISYSTHGFTTLFKIIWPLRSHRRLFTFLSFIMHVNKNTCPLIMKSLLIE